MRLFRLLVVAAALAATPLYGAVEGSFDRTLNVAGAVDLTVSTGSGSIRVRGGGEGAVRVHGFIRAGDDGTMRGEEKVRYIAANPPVAQTGNTIRIGRIEDPRYRNHVSISYEIEVPQDTRLQSQTGSGEQSIEGIRGPAQVSTGSGKITASGIEGDLQAKTGSGEIQLDNVRGAVTATTGSGSIRGTQVGGSVVAHTGSGSIQLQQGNSGNVDLKTGSGKVDVSGVRGALQVSTGSGDITAAGEAAGPWKLSAGSGGILLHLPSGAGFNIDAHTSGGRVQIDHELSQTETRSPKELRGKVRGGGTPVELRTGSGDIRIQ
jgi:hypothetical protein